MLLIDAAPPLACAFLVAQTPSMDPGIGTLVGNLGIMGVLVWHLWYHTTRSYPEMIAKFTAEQEKSRKAFLDEQTAARAMFVSEQQESREAFLREQRDSRDSSARETAELRSMLVQTMTSMRVAVHDVRDTAQVTMNKQEIARQQ